MGWAFAALTSAIDLTSAPMHFASSPSGPDTRALFDGRSADILEGGGFFPFEVFLGEKKEFGFDPPFGHVSLSSTASYGGIEAVENSHGCHATTPDSTADVGLVPFARSAGRRVQISPRVLTACANGRGKKKTGDAGSSPGGSARDDPLGARPVQGCTVRNRNALRSVIVNPPRCFYTGSHTPAEQVEQVAK